MNPTIYVLTHHKFNHTAARAGFKPLDERFLKSDRRYVYYLIDEETPEVLKNKEVLHEKRIDPLLFEAGAKYFAEWSFLLNERKHGFCTYPFFMISSRFYEKNEWLYRSLDEEWESLFGYLQQYGWGWLPSYDRRLRWVSLEWKKRVEKGARCHEFFPFKEPFFALLKELYPIPIPEEYRETADLFCNYIGFKSRSELCAYVDFYQPLIDYFFDANYHLKQELSRFIRPAAVHNYKPFAFFLEWLSHFYLYAIKKPYMALHYDGYYLVDEGQREMKRLESFNLPLLTVLERTVNGSVKDLKVRLHHFLDLYLKT